MTRGVCQHCFCTEHRPCMGGCFWIDAEQTVCSRCAIDLGIAEELQSGVLVIDGAMHLDLFTMCLAAGYAPTEENMATLAEAAQLAFAEQNAEVELREGGDFRWP